MKTKETLLSLVFGLTILGASSQITFENSIASGTVNNQAFSLVKLSNSGYKYVNLTANGTIELYNLDLTIFRTLSYTPTISNGNEDCLFISEDLFDNNSANIEFLISSYDFGTHVSSVHVFQEDGTALFSRDSIAFPGYEVLWRTPFISYTSGGVKMFLADQFNDSIYTYSLPGNLVCHECTGGQVSGLIQNTGADFSGILPFPNPSLNEVKIRYSLPHNQSNSEIRIYDMNGKEIQKIRIDPVLQEITLNKTSLGVGSGMYQFKIYCGNKIMDSNKFVFE